jgi:hypothetical protein
MYSPRRSGLLRWRLPPWWSWRFSGSASNRVSKRPQATATASVPANEQAANGPLSGDPSLIPANRSPPAEIHPRGWGARPANRALWPRQLLSVSSRGQVGHLHGEPPPTRLEPGTGSPSPMPAWPCIWPPQPSPPGRLTWTVRGRAQLRSASW